MANGPLRLWLISLICQLAAIGFSQYNYTRVYTILDGLSYTETNMCYIDRSGLLWTVSTKGNLAVFDGYRFYTELPHLQTEVSFVHRPTEDKHGMFLLKNKDIRFRQGNEWIKVNSPEFINAFVMAGTDELYLIDKFGTYFTFATDQQAFTKKGQFFIPPDPKLSTVGFDRVGVYCLQDTSYLLISRADGYAYWYEHLQDSEPELLKFPGFSTVLPFSKSKHLILNHDGDHSALQWYENGNYSPAFGINEAGQKVYFDESNFRIFDQQLYIIHRNAALSRENQNVFEVWEMGKDQQLKLYCRFKLAAPANTNNISVDPLGHVWLPAQSGLIKVYPTVMHLSENAPNMVAGLHVINEDLKGNIWFGSYRNGFAYFDGFNVKNPPPAANPYRNIMPGTWRDEHGFMYFFKENAYGFFKTDGKTWLSNPEPYTPENRLTGYYFVPLQNGQLAAGLFRQGIGLLDPPYAVGQPWQNIGKNKGLLLDNVITISEDIAGRLWCGRLSQGIGVYDPKRDTAVTWLRTDNEGWGSMCSETDSKGNLWLGTQTGLAWLEAPHQIDIFSEDINDHIRPLKLPQVGPYTVTFMKEHDGFLIFGNTHGFGLLDLASFYRNLDHPKVFFFNTLEEYPGRSSEQNSIHIDRNEGIWMGNDLGATRLDWKKLRLDTLSPDFQFTSLLTGKGEHFQFNSEKTLRLPRGDRNLQLSYQFLNNRSLQANAWISYALLINGQPEDTLSSHFFLRKENIRFGYLPPGHHQLHVQVYKNNQILDHYTYTIIVPKFLEENPWAYFWGMFIVFSVIGGMAYFRYLNYRQRQQHKLEKVELLREKEQFQIQAIISSLNPHFINNTLHWLQAKVFDDKTAVKVIDRLANNIQILFQRSRKNEPFHTLAEEMKLVENYLVIQNNRFDNRYQYHPPDPGVLARLKETNVPLMQIQIHVENAIEHGLRNREGSSYVSIGIEEWEDWLKIIVEDDGVGYSRAKELRSRGTQQGTKMLKSLHKIFNTRNQRKITTEIEENIYLDNNSQGYGTRITISIPKLYSYELEQSKSNSS